MSRFSNRISREITKREREKDRDDYSYVAENLPGDGSRSDTTLEETMNFGLLDRWNVPRNWGRSVQDNYVRLFSNEKDEGNNRTGNHHYKGVLFDPFGVSRGALKIDVEGDRPKGNIPVLANDERTHRGYMLAIAASNPLAIINYVSRTCDYDKTRELVMRLAADFELETGKPANVALDEMMDFK